MNIILNFYRDSNMWEDAKRVAKDHFPDQLQTIKVLFWNF